VGTGKKKFVVDKHNKDVALSENMNLLVFYVG